MLRLQAAIAIKQQDFTKEHSSLCTGLKQSGAGKSQEEHSGGLKLGHQTPQSLKVISVDGGQFETIFYSTVYFGQQYARD